MKGNEDSNINNRIGRIVFLAQEMRSNALCVNEKTNHSSNEINTIIMVEAGTVA